MSMAPVPEPMFAAPAMAPSVMSPVMAGYPAAEPYGMAPVVPYGPAPFGGVGPAVPPPPGTLGYTYKRYTRPVPTDEHPRLAMLEVYGAPKGLKLTVHDMEGFVDDKGVWHFKSKSPLMMGVSHVRQVLVWNENGSLNEPLVRHLRLIPGRVVELDY